MEVVSYTKDFKKRGTWKTKRPCSVVKSLLPQPQAWRKSYSLQVGASEKSFLYQIWHILRWIHTGLASKGISFDGVANKATVFCCCANTFLSFFMWPPANDTCYFCLGNLLSWKGKYETTLQRKARKLLAVGIIGPSSIGTKLSLIKWKYSEGKNNPLASNQQNSSKRPPQGLTLTDHLFPNRLHSCSKHGSPCSRQPRPPLLIYAIHKDPWNKNSSSLHSLLELSLSLLP